MKWEVHGYCKKCGWHDYAPFGSLFHMSIACCPACGNDKDTFHADWNDWGTQTMAWVSEAVWWKPSTWSKGKWIIKDETNK